MNIRKTALIAPTALLAGAMMLPVGVTAASASPTHTASGAVTQATQALSSTSSTSSTQDWQNGYRDGYRAGWNQAKDDCKVPDNSNHHHAAMVHTDYTDGFDAGFPKGFAAGFPEYCS